MASDTPVCESITPLGFPWQTRDPFLFCVYHLDAYPRGNGRLGPDASLAGRALGNDFQVKDGWRMYHGREIPGFPQHPHRGFETVTVVRKGLVDHADSLGATARYGQGDVQWLTAGGGIQHAEMFPLVDNDNPLELFQIWLNLPAAQKMVPAHFTMMWRDAIPVHRIVDANGFTTEVTTVAGKLATADGNNTALAIPKPPPDSWAASDTSDVAIWTLRIPAGGSFHLPAAQAGSHRDIYFFAGDELTAAGEVIPQDHGAALRPDVEVELRAGASDVQVLLLQGQPIGEPVAHHGPFVMNSRTELEQAFADYRRTQFGGWPWPDPAPVHAADKGRFASHADGRAEDPG